MNTVNRRDFLKLSGLVALGGLAPWRTQVGDALLEHSRLADVPSAIDIAEHFDVVEAQLSKVLVQINGRSIIGVWAAEIGTVPAIWSNDLNRAGPLSLAPAAVEVRLQWAGWPERYKSDVYPYLASGESLDITMSLPDAPELMYSGSVMVTEIREEMRFRPVGYWPREVREVADQLVCADVLFRSLGSWTVGG